VRLLAFDQPNERIAISPLRAANQLVLNGHDVRFARSAGLPSGSGCLLPSVAEESRGDRVAVRDQAGDLGWREPGCAEGAVFALEQG